MSNSDGLVRSCVICHFRRRLRQLERDFEWGALGFELEKLYRVAVTPQRDMLSTNPSQSSGSSHRSDRVSRALSEYVWISCISVEELNICLRGMVGCFIL